jgi:hypothetical protein
MEALTPLQRIVVIAIVLALTLALALLIVPWLSKQIEERLIPDESEALDASALRQPPLCCRQAPAVSQMPQPPPMPTEVEISSKKRGGLQGPASPLF